MSEHSATKSLQHRGGTTVSTLGEKSKNKTLPWRQPQKAWSPGILRGTGMPRPDIFTRNKPGEGRLNTSGKVAIFEEPARYCQLGASARQQHDACFQASKSPPSRREMEPELCAQQVERWWPYKGT